jgi:sarcosine oxidase subunit beta
MPDPVDRRTATPVDVVVIGAGIVGASCAFHLADRGLRVAVLDAFEAPAQGSTGRSFASVRGQWEDPLNIELSWRSIQSYRDFPQLHGVDVGYRPSGYLLLIPSARWERQLRAVDVQRSLGVPVDVLDLDAAAAITPFDPTGLGGATWGRADGVVDPHQATLAYLRLARDRGATVHLRQPVTALAPQGGSWLVHSADHRFAAGHVLNAAGGWAADVAALAGLDVPVQHVRRNIYASAADPSAPRYPMTIDAGSGVFLRSEGARLLFSVARPDEPAGYQTSVDWPWMETVLERACPRFPWLADVPLDRAACWAGTYEISPDQLPILGRNPHASGWVDVCGFSGHGVMQAPEVGRLMAEEIVDGVAHSLDITALGHRRLSSGAVAVDELIF